MYDLSGPTLRLFRLEETVTRALLHLRLWFGRYDQVLNGDARRACRGRLPSGGSEAGAYPHSNPGRFRCLGGTGRVPEWTEGSGPRRSTRSTFVPPESSVDGARVPNFLLNTGGRSGVSTPCSAWMRELIVGQVVVNTPDAGKPRKKRTLSGRRGYCSVPVPSCVDITDAPVDGARILSNQDLRHW
ncbi:hypothetical protein OF83DRAFT_1080216 [Amylostereum chailletii]|nr:hypothetical protein OF83DRAFT_1080216 [Amylostereum chailletii]